MDLLPSELIEEIMLNLPHKYLVRFSVVSKSWRWMIFDPIFARKHINRAALLGRHKLAVYIDTHMHDIDVASVLSSKTRHESCDGSDPSFSVFSNAKDDVRDFVGLFEGKPRLLSCCDELWCVQVKNSLFLWNPSMRNIVKVLPPPSSLLKDSDDFLYGLAYDSVNDDYKILKMERKLPGSELYSLKNNCWRKIKSFDVRPSFNQRRCEFVGGRFHWIGYTTAEAQIIAYFDLSNDEYGEMAVPHEYDDDEGDRYELEVVILNGKLCAYGNYEDYDEEETQFVLWVMEEYGVEKSWTKRFDFMVRRPSNLGVRCSMPDTLTPLYLSDNNDLLVRIDGCCTKDICILMYRNGEAGPVTIVKYENSGYCDFDAFLYVESLITSLHELA